MKAKVLRSRHKNKFTDDNQFIFSNEKFEEKKPKKVMLQNQEQYEEEDNRENWFRDEQEDRRTWDRGPLAPLNL